MFSGATVIVNMLCYFIYKVHGYIVHVVRYYVTVAKNRLVASIPLKLH